MPDEPEPGGEWGRHAARSSTGGPARARALGLIFLVLLAAGLAGDSALGWIVCAFAGGQDAAACIARWVGGHYQLYVAALAVMAIILVAVRLRKR